MCAGAAGNDDMNNCGRCRAPRPASPQRGGAGNDGAGKALSGAAPEGDGDGDGDSSDKEDATATPRWANAREFLLPPDPKARSLVHKAMRCVLLQPTSCGGSGGWRVRFVTRHLVEASSAVAALLR